MGTIKQGILGGFSGKVGKVIGGTWKGIDYMRGIPSSVSNPQTEGQVTQRNKFGACIALAKSVIDSIIRPIWNRKAVKMTGINLFTKTNLPVFNELGEIVDFDNLKFSIGDLPLPTNLVIENNLAGNGAIHVAWTDNSGTGYAAPTDNIRVLVMCDGELVILQGLHFPRETAWANFQIPFVTGQTVHIYVFFENEAKTKYSTSQHGMLVIA
jgi:hypothetical protein